VVAWTVNDPARARRLRDLGVDGVTTDRIAVLHALNGRA
jgi:glycerophosphoryl diester phosphodiesterase